MPHIEILSPFVADLIAAGEVVERPASAVKELLENALDAGAKNIVLELRGGGRALIRVTDDGGGMAPEDAGIAFMRHATSKLRDERGLEAIGTLGFRGEALAAIAAVSRIELTTRERGQAMGVRMAVSAGEIAEMHETGCPEGTTLIVRDLFYNTPARLKFMGSDRAEGSRCVAAALACALGRPEVSLRCIKDGKDEFQSPGDGRADSCIYTLLGREMAASLLPCQSEDGGVKVHGFVSKPMAGRGNRAAQYFFVNGRPIRSRTLQAAIEQAYKNTAMAGRFPACVLYIELSPASVDVNVHPAKTEVKFSDEKRVFDGVYYAALAALGGEDRLAAVPAAQPAAAPPALGGAPFSTPKTPAATTGASEPRADFFRHMDATAFRQSQGRHATGQAPRPAPADSGLLRDSAPPLRVGTPGIYRAELSAETPPAQTVLDGSFQTEATRLIGEALHVYILVEAGERLLLIDKHATHERILFDRLRLAEQPVMSQGLIAPAVLRPGGDGAELLLENQTALEKLGFELEPFGEDAVALRAVPADIDMDEAQATLEELLDKLREGRHLSAQDIWEKLAHTVACKAAIKAGRDSSPEELRALLGRVLSGEVKYCPHGRPVVISFTRAELGKRFGR